MAFAQEKILVLVILAMALGSTLAADDAVVSNANSTDTTTNFNVTCSLGAVTDCTNVNGGTPITFLKSVSDDTCSKAKTYIACIDQAIGKCENGAVKTGLSTGAKPGKMLYERQCGGVAGLASSAILCMLLVVSSIFLRD